MGDKAIEDVIMTVNRAYPISVICEPPPALSQISTHAFPLTPA